MKKLLFIALLLSSIVSFGQTTATSNPFIVKGASTAVFYVTIPAGNTVLNPNSSTNYPASVFLKVYKSNAGSVQYNTTNSTMTTTPKILGGGDVDEFDFVTVKGKLYFKFSNYATDSVKISW